MVSGNLEFGVWEEAEIGMATSVPGPALVHAVTGSGLAPSEQTGMGRVVGEPGEAW